VTGGVFKNLLVVHAEQGVKVAGGTQMNFGGWGYGGVYQPEMARGGLLQLDED